MKPGLVTFTFDDGISSNTELLLTKLEAENIKATFFIIGETLASKKNCDLLKEIHEKGHIIGNHTWSHANLIKLNVLDLKKEILQTENKIKSIIEKPLAYMRPPYGSINPDVKQHLIDLGYKVVLWNIDAQDWDIKKSKSTMLSYYKKTFASANKDKDRYIILQHDRRKDSVELVPELANLLRNKGFEIVSLDTYFAS